MVQVKVVPQSYVEYGMLQPTVMVPGGLPKEEDPPGAGHTPGEAPSAILQDIAQNAGWRLPLPWLLGTEKNKKDLYQWKNA